MDHTLYPVTALAIVNLSSKILIWLAKDLSYGFTTNLHLRLENSNAVRVLLWGGQFVSVIQIECFTNYEKNLDLTIQDFIPETRLEDWILDACFRSQGEGIEIDASEVVLVTSHNVLFYLYIPPESNKDYGTEVSMHQVAAGPRSILYSAHVIWPLAGLGLVAAGTVYGEVLLWSFIGDGISSLSKRTFSYDLHYVFRGHEGSVFGVKISELMDGEKSAARRILASCSDDRTIRIWDISTLSSKIPYGSPQRDSSSTLIDSGEDFNGHDHWEMSQPLAIAMGHSSRIWDLRILFQKSSDLLVLSFGEDATTQLWRLSNELNDQEADEGSREREIFLHHQFRFPFHSKKNIWASAVSAQFNSSYLIGTGGADGRIVCFDLHYWQGSLQVGNQLSLNLTNDKLFEGTEYIERSPTLNEIEISKTHNQVAPEKLFTTLKGKWKLFRKLQSTISSYPSGTLEGTAVFERRTPTSHEYDDEYLYTENGQFLTEQGLALTAHRRYVYRFQKKTNMITVWFVKPDNESTVDYFFHPLEFASTKTESLEPREERNSQFMKAKSQHLCIDDIYQVNYLFEFENSQCNEWGLEYVVKGPKKDYVANGKYLRENATQTWEHESNFEEIKKYASNVTNIEENSELGSLYSKVGHFKSYTWISRTELLASTAGGLLLLGILRSSGKEINSETISDSLLTISWREVGQLDDLKHSCVFTSIQSYGLVHFAGLSGTIYCYRHSDRSLQAQMQAARNVCYLESHLLDHASAQDVGGLLRLGVVVACIGSGIVNVFLIIMGPVPSAQFSSLVLLNQKHDLVITSSCFAFSEEIVILGSRKGAIAVYNIVLLEDISVELDTIYYRENIHGNEAITSITILPSKVPESDISVQYILTTGRNGAFSIHQLRYDRRESRETSINFQTVHVGTPPFGPNIEGAFFEEKTMNLLLWGFRSKDFVVWNESQNTEIMTVECGGVHRNWAFAPHDNEKGGGSLIWTKASTCNVHVQSRASHEVLSHGGHGREIKAMAISPPIEAGGCSFQRLIATGAEDTFIHIFGARDSKNMGLEHDFKCLGMITKHTTGIQQLRWSLDGQRLFSAAGCEEFFVWRIRSVPCLGLGIICEFNCKAVTKSSDLRIMDFDVAEIKEGEDAVGPDFYRCMISMVYSNSSVRVFTYTSKSGRNTFETLFIGSYMTYCLTQVIQLLVGSTFQLLTASTDGHIALWPLTEGLQEKQIAKTNQQPPNPQISPTSPREISWHARTKIHQSSIKAMESILLSPLKILLVTGGDDGALAFTLIAYFSKNPADPPLYSILIIPKAHASAINAIASMHENPASTSTSTSPSKSNPSLSYRFATASNDQKFKTWHVTVIPSDNPGVEGLKVERLRNEHSCVADVACLERFEDVGVVVAGIGMEIWREG